MTALPLTLPASMPLVLPAHGVGTRQDLPLSFTAVLVGASLVLAISFAALGLLWREPRLRRNGGRPVAAPVAAVAGSRALRAVAVAVTLAVTALTLVALAAGSDGADNPAAYVVFVWLWIGVAFISLLVGPVWAVVNPMRWLHLGLCRLTRLDPDQPALGGSLGYWPAAIGLFGFTWLELIAPDRTTRPTLGIAVVVFVSLSVMGSTLYGRAWFARSDPFEVWSRLLGSLSVLGRRDDGVWVWRSPLHGVERIPLDRGLLAAVSVMLGGTAYDGFSNEAVWYRTVQSSTLPSSLIETGGLVFFALLVAGSLSAAAALSARLAGQPVRGSALALAPSLVPVAAGYVIAHYWSLGIDEGQHALALVSDPLGTGADLFGTAGLAPDATLLAPQLVALVQVSAIVLGHLLGVISAHERALVMAGRRGAVVGQLPLLAVMIGYTCGGLTLLFSS